ncbi:glycosyltransferase family 4 protein [bacterium]|nr:glycosyltransferase family 4 protein [bacterium]
MDKDKNTKKILFVHHGKVLGGAPVSLLNTIIGLERMGCDNIKILFVYNDIKPFFKENCNAKIGDIYNPCLYLGRVLIGWADIKISKAHIILKELFLFPLSVYRQYKTFKREDPDIIHLNSSILFSSAIAVKISGYKLVWHVREILIDKKNFLKLFSGWLIKKLADRVITISEAEKISLGLRNNSNVEVVYNFLDFDKFDYKKFNKDEEKNKLGFKERDKIVLCIANFSKRKGILEIVESLRYLKNNVYIIIVGIGEGDVRGKNYLNDSYKKKVLEVLNDSDKNKIKLAGFQIQKDVIRYIVACDLLIAPWTSPHFARPIFEAWAMKRPIIAFNISGIKENVRNGEDGILVNDMSSRGLADAINDVIFDDSKMKYVAERGYDRADKQFRQEVNVKKIYYIYNNL